MEREAFKQAIRDFVDSIKDDLHKLETFRNFLIKNESSDSIYTVKEIEIFEEVSTFIETKAQPRVN